MKHLLFSLLCLPLLLKAENPPNVIFVLVDNLGNGDVKCFNPQTLHRTPHLDQMAVEGTRFTSYYSASGVCTPSRAALMTGCYPYRVDMHVSDKGGLVLQPVAAKGLNPKETTVAEVMKTAGYTTAIIGKWHLGDQPEFLPTRQGFDSFFGIPYSDDMVKELRPDEWPELPLMRDEKVIEAPVDRDNLTKRYTEEAVKFITAHQDKPFFLYLPHAMPGSTKDPYASPAFKDKSANGHWGDSIEELDWSMGEILSTLKKLHLDEKTLVIWTSDNGAPNRKPPQGSNAPYEGWGYNTSEGAMRVPCIARWPGHVQAGRECRELCSMMDILPTLATMTGVKKPTHTIDGHDITTLLLGQSGATSPSDASGFFYYFGDQLQAVRSGPWKLYLPLEAKRMGGAKKQASPMQLFNVRDDESEKEEVSNAHPRIVERLMKLADEAREELGDADRIGKGHREAGHVDQPTARVKL
ncbi:MAG: sulfatase [Prosthecobacter sp.]|nr:sulfatase [Prosthecobacter sp.]